MSLENLAKLQNTFELKYCRLPIPIQKTTFILMASVIGSGQRQMAGTCKRGNEPLGSTQYGKVLD